MTGTREHDIIQAFVALSNELADGYDAIDLLTGLTVDCARLLDIAAAGLLLADARGVLHIVAASSERTRTLELYQLQRDEGPCLDCFRAGQPVSVPDLAAELDRWPHFVPAARASGFAAVHALPMRLRDNVLGTLGLFSAHPGPLQPDDRELAQALAHVASVAIVNEAAATDRDALNAQLQRALDSRIVLEQAKGLIAHTGDLDMDDAFRVLRQYARDHQHKLTDVAMQVVTRRIPGAHLIAHAKASSVLPP